MKLQVLLFSGLLSTAPLLSGAAESAHREHGAHVHGAGQMNIAFDGLQGEVDYDGSAMNIVGFEHKAKSAKDKATLSENLKKFETQIDKILVFDSSLGCQFTDRKVELENGGGEHSDINGKFKIACKKSPLGSTLKVDFSGTFPDLKKVQIQLIADNLQKSVTLEKFPADVVLKP